MALLMAVALANGCATVGTGGSGRPAEVPLDVDEDVLEQGAKAEATRAVAQVWAVARSVRAVGARLSFSFWAERGALTLTGYAATGHDGSVGHAVDDEALRHTLSTVLKSFAQRHTGAVEVILERLEMGWRVGYSRLPGSRPLEAKTLPVRSDVLPLDPEESVTEGLAKLLKALHVPEGAEAHVEVAAHLEDGRLEEWEIERFELVRQTTAGARWEPTARAVDEAASVVLPFTEGIGERTLRLSLRLVSPRGSPWMSGQVEVARVVHAPPPPEANAEFVAEYRLLVEDILRRWREDTKEGAKWVARRGVEELALWYAFGILTKGVGWLGARTLPTVKLALSRGGEAAAGWLRTTLKRVPVERKLAFERLWTKAHLEGKQALSKGERAELRELMEGIEQLVKTPLDPTAKRKLRDAARESYKRSHPRFAKLLDEKSTDLPIHHRCPL
ncbi:hypothetical protein, partial [Hyalangium sp.]|uniref:hypothetical protein n=1 Tax=Hyalangium sp. TaxID=2028555 RepID=UPI002D755B81